MAATAKVDTTREGITLFAKPAGKAQGIALVVGVPSAIEVAAKVRL